MSAPRSLVRALLFAALLCAAVAQLINTSRSNIKRMVMKTVDNSGEASTWSFDEIKLTETEVEVVETEEGDAKVSKRPGKAKYSNIVLSKAAMDGSIAQWWSKVQDAAEKGSDVESLRKSGSIIYLDRAGNEVLRYKVSGCWPRRWKAPELNANADTVVASNEEMELACDRVDREP